MYGNNPMFSLSVFIGVHLWLIILDTSEFAYNNLACRNIKFLLYQENNAIFLQFLKPFFHACPIPALRQGWTNKDL